ncbi:high-affinity nickel-transporter [Fusarium denticulatum]|uniref:High-affinity nickel-transporter n=1 Tax=Fusarium denticulatum TaxID=48507 RepID=A0A8H5XG43_9HYPO|nr:high-affinity nickel-transporter [Fusarium denticulatum]
MPRFTIPDLQNLSKPKFLSGIPNNSIFAIATLIAVNALVWIAAGIVLHFHPRLISPAALSYVLGLRHALDADHIAAIDLMTRRLIASGQRPATVGTFFSLGHSTIVIVTCIVVAATSGALRERFDGFQRVGNIVGTSVSAAFLIILCIGNGWVLYKLIQRLQTLLQERRNQVRLEGFVEEETQIQDHFALEGGGFLTRVFKRLFRVIDRPWKMYPLGVVFGLGFDTSSEIAILGIASIQAVQGTSIWLILIFPILFTAGMCMLDTTDGALMMALYTSKAFSRDVVAILYYSIVLTGITVVVSAFIGIVQVLSLIQNVADPQGRFWDGVSSIGDHFDIVGGSICGVFLIVGLGSIFVYKPWRRHVERQQQSLIQDPEPSLDAQSPAPSTERFVTIGFGNFIDIDISVNINIMDSKTSSDTLPDPSMDELESQDLQGQSTPNVDIIDDDDNTALNLGIDYVPIRLPLFPQETFTNPLTYSREETINALLRILKQDWDDAQANGTIQPENPVTEAPPPTSEAPTTQSRQLTKSPTGNASVPQSSPAPSAAPNVKAVPQAKTRGVKRAREPEPWLPKRRYRLIAPKPPKIDVPCQQQVLPVNMPPSRADFQYPNAPVSFAATGGSIRDSGQLNRHLQLAQMGLSPHSIPSPHNGNAPWSSPVLPQQQARMGFNPPVAPFSHSGSMTLSSPESSVESFNPPVTPFSHSGSMTLSSPESSVESFNPPVTPFSHSGDVTGSSPGSSVESWEAFSISTPRDGGTFMGRPAARRMDFGLLLPGQQAQMAMNPHSVPSPHNGNVAFSSHVPPPQQLHNGMTMGSMGHHNQPVGNGIPTVYQNVPSNSSVGHLQPRVNGNAMKMHQHNGPFIRYCQPRRFG